MRSSVKALVPACALALASGCGGAGGPTEGAAQRHEPAATCRLPGTPALVHRDGSAVQLVWELEDAPVLWSDALPASEAFAAFRAEVARRVPDLDPRALLRRTYERDEPPADEDDRKQRGNNRLIAEGEVGRLRPINCLEAALVAYQAERVPMIERPTELHGIIVSRTGAAGTRHRVYVAASDELFPPKPEQIVERVDADLAAGWHLAAHLHNHTWHLGEAGAASGAAAATGDGVALPAPSTPDVHYYRALRASRGLRRALVTNGFHTVEIDAAELDALEAREVAGAAGLTPAR